MKLCGMKCEVCQAGAPPVSNADTIEFKKQIPDWKIIQEDGIPKIRRVFQFPDFANAIAFTDRVGELAEEYNHHPALLTEWGNVTVTWWTHKIHGLHRNDFIMAAKTDQLVTPSV